MRLKSMAKPALKFYIQRLEQRLHALQTIHEAFSDEPSHDVHGEIVGEQVAIAREIVFARGIK